VSRLCGATAHSPTTPGSASARPTERGQGRGAGGEEALAWSRRLTPVWGNCVINVHILGVDNSGLRHNHGRQRFCTCRVICCERGGSSPSPNVWSIS
jgi:hypothetical protein